MSERKGFLARLRAKGWKEGPEGWLPPPPGTKPSVLPRATTRPAPRRRAGMNSLEARYTDEVLSAEVASGTICLWSFEPVRLRLAPKTFYTPDFMVICSDGTVSFREVKGFLREDAAVKFKWARELYPYFDFKMVERRQGKWRELLPSSKPCLGKKTPLTRRPAKG